MKTFSAKPQEVERKWYVIDAADKVLGRVAVEAANILRGKNKTIFTPHVDCGDFVIIVNADKVVLTGRKYTDKKYYWHTGYIGGIKERKARQILEGRFPERVLEKLRNPALDASASAPCGGTRREALAAADDADDAIDF